MNQQLLKKQESSEKVYYILPFIPNNKIVSQETNVSDRWMCQVTPNDGDLDLSLTGCCDKHRTYRNNGSTFIEAQREGELSGVFAGSQAFGDYNNDGYLDLIVNGREETTTLFVYNISSTNFTLWLYDPESDVGNLIFGSIAWIDLDNDNDLDLIETGYGNFDSRAYVYLSNRSLTKNNTLPTPPNILISSYSTANNTLTLGWNNGSDNETLSMGLYYNLMVGNSTTNNTIVSGVYGGSSNPTAGYFGNMMQRKNITLNLVLPEGTYYWYVQTIDTGLAKSNWSARQSFTVNADITPPIISSVSSSVTASTATITWTTDEMANSSVYYGTTTATTSSSSSSGLTMSHSIGLSSLSASTLYYYNVSSCDDSGNCNTSQQSNFTTSDVPVTPPASPSGGGGGGTPVTPANKTTNQTLSKFDIDFSNASGGNLEAKQGDIKTFSFNNNVTHKITITELTTTSAKLIIESEPIILILTLGETKQIDINKDNINDIEIRLISIISGKASFSLTKLTGASVVAKEELGKEALFDARVSIATLFQVIRSGREVISEIQVFNVNNIGRVDVTVNYYITSKQDNQTRLVEGSDTLAVEAVASFVRSLIVPYNTKAGVYYFNVDIKYQDKLMASSHAEFTVIRNYEIFIAVGIVILLIVGIFFYLWKIRKREEKLESKERRDIKILKQEMKKLKRYKKWQK